MATDASEARPPERFRSVAFVLDLRFGRGHRSAPRSHVSELSHRACVGYSVATGHSSRHNPVRRPRVTAKGSSHQLVPDVARKRDTLWCLVQFG